MNKTDTEKIGYALAVATTHDDLVRMFIDIDPRIKEEYELYSQAVQEDEAVTEEFDRLMTEKYGVQWPIRKEELMPDRRQIWRQAEQSIRRG